MRSKQVDINMMGSMHLESWDMNILSEDQHNAPGHVFLLGSF